MNSFITLYIKHIFSEIINMNESIIIIINLSEVFCKKII